MTSRHAPAALAAGLVLVYLAASLVVAGRPLFWPKNGPYNLFAGSNLSARDSLVTEYNAEPSLPQAMSWCGQAEPARTAPPAVLLRCFRRFVLESPLQAVSVTAFKFYNLILRPNLRLADSATEKAVQVGMVMVPLFWWGLNLYALLSTGRPVDPYAMAFILLFALPFIVTNSVPRFRLPLDAIYAASLMQVAVQSSASRDTRLGAAA